MITYEKQAISQNLQISFPQIIYFKSNSTEEIKKYPKQVIKISITNKGQIPWTSRFDALEKILYHLCIQSKIHNHEETQIEDIL